LLGDPSKAKSKLGWKPKYDLPALVNEMVLADLHLMKKDEYLNNGGFNTLNYFE
jgi:GDPmannose 4,6-dehydratase